MLLQVASWHAPTFWALQPSLSYFAADNNEPTSADVCTFNAFYGEDLDYLLSFPMLFRRPARGTQTARRAWLRWTRTAQKLLKKPAMPLLQRSAACTGRSAARTPSFWLSRVSANNVVPLTVGYSEICTCTTAVPMRSCLCSKVIACSYLVFDRRHR